MTDKDSDQGDSDQAALQMLTQENPTSSNTHASMECLNMSKLRMVPPHFCLWTARKVKMSPTSETKMPYV